MVLFRMASGYLSQARLKAFSDCLHRIYGEPTGENPLTSIMDAIEQLLPMNSLSVDQVNPVDLSMKHIDDRYTEGMPEIHEVVSQLIHDHPGVQHLIKHGPMPMQRLSDFVSERQLREISLYEHVRKLHTFRDQACMLVGVPDGAMAFVVNHDRIYTDEQVELLALLQPHVQRVMGRCALFARFTTNGHLTPREREVLFWMTRGKRDEEMATILRVGVRTIHEHVRRILAKLNVENRTSAVAVVLSGSEVEGAPSWGGDVRS